MSTKVPIPKTAALLRHQNVDMPISGQANLKNIYVCCLPTDPPFYPRPNIFLGHLLGKKILASICKQFSFKIVSFYWTGSKKHLFLHTDPVWKFWVGEQQTIFSRLAPAKWPAVSSPSEVITMLDRAKLHIHCNLKNIRYEKRLLWASTIKAIQNHKVWEKTLWASTIEAIQNHKVWEKTLWASTIKAIQNHKVWEKTLVG